MNDEHFFPFFLLFPFSLHSSFSRSLCFLNEHCTGFLCKVFFVWIVWAWPVMGVVCSFLIIGFRAAVAAYFKRASSYILFVGMSRFFGEN